MLEDAFLRPLSRKDTPLERKHNLATRQPAPLPASSPQCPFTPRGTEAGRQPASHRASPAEEGQRCPQLPYPLSSALCRCGMISLKENKVRATPRLRTPVRVYLE